VDLIVNGVARQLGYAGLTDPAALPLFLFVLSIFGLVWAPLTNAISRFYERQCDRYALDHTHNKVAYRSAFMKWRGSTSPTPIRTRSLLCCSTIIRRFANAWRWRIMNR